MIGESHRKAWMSQLPPQTSESRTFRTENLYLLHSGYQQVDCLRKRDALANDDGQEAGNGNNEVNVDHAAAREAPWAGTVDVRKYIRCGT